MGACGVYLGTPADVLTNHTAGDDNDYAGAHTSRPPQ